MCEEFSYKRILIFKEVFGRWRTDTNDAGALTSERRIQPSEQGTLGGLGFRVQGESQCVGGVDVGTESKVLSMMQAWIVEW